MKNKRLNTRKLRYVFYTLLTCVLCVGCADSPNFVELDEFIKDHSKYYKMVVWGSLDGVNYYCADTILVKDGEVLIYKGRAGNAR